MSYSGTMTGTEWLYMIQAKAQNLINLINEGNSFYLKWYAFTYGQTADQVGTAIGLSTQEATDMLAAFQVLKELNDALSSVPVTADDRRTKLLKFV